VSRVALLTTSFPTDDDDPSGHFVAAHARLLAREGAAVSVLALGGRAHGVERRGQLEIRWLGGERLFGWPGAAERLHASPLEARFAIVPALRGARAVRAFDRIVAHWIVPSAFPLAWIARSTDVEVWAHGADVRLLSNRPRLARAVARSLLASSARFVFVASALRDAFMDVLGSELGARMRARSRVEPAPIDVPPRAQLSDPRDPGELVRGYALWVGRWVDDKRPEVAARAAAVAGVPLVMIGGAPSENAPPFLNAVVKGRLGRTQTLRWIAHASALVSTSRYEGAPTVVREARMLQIPVVAMPAGDIATRAEHDPGVHVVHGETELAGWLARNVGA